MSPLRIVSLLPSATEMVCRLGLGEHLVGVTHECDYPPWVANLPKVTQTLIPTDATSQTIDALVRERLQQQKSLYSLNRPVLEQLQPTLIVTQALCEVCAVAETEVQSAACSLASRPRIVNLEPTCLSEVLDNLRLVAEAAGAPQRAEAVVAELTQRVRSVVQRSQRVRTRPRVVLLEWVDPPFSCGHWSPELVRLAGGVEALGCEGQPSRSLTWDEVRAVDPEVLMLACCGFSVERTLADWPILQRFPAFEQLACVRTGRIFVVDGSAYFSRPGPRLVDSLEILAHALHPDEHPPCPWGRAWQWQADRWRPGSTVPA